MIKEKDLQEIRRYKDRQDISLQTIQNALGGVAQQSSIPIAFYIEQLKGNGFLSGTENCLVLYHPEHQKDYFSIAIRVKDQEVSAGILGVSKLMKSEAVRKQVNAVAKEGINYRGYNPLQNAVAGASFVAAGVAGVRHLANKGKLEEEQQWYTSICGIFDEIFSSGTAE